MNSKLACQLRHAAGYRNATATPSRLKFPGVAGLRQFPLVERRDGKIVMSGRTAPNGKFWSFQPVIAMGFNKETGLPEMKYDVIPVSRPAVHDPQSPRGKYRALKKLERAVGLENILIGATKAAHRG